MLCLIQEEIIPHYLKDRMRKKNEKDISGTSLINTGLSLSQVSSSPVLDPDIKGLRESFPPFRVWAHVPASSALICATCLPIISWNDTLFKSLSPLLNTDSLGLLTHSHQPVLSYPGLAVLCILLFDVSRLPRSCLGASHPKGFYKQTGTNLWEDSSFITCG